MKKLFSKIAALSVGLALAIGFGVAVSHETKEADAATVGTSLAQVTELTSGNQYVIVGNNNGYALPTNPTVNNGKITGTAIASVPDDGAGYLWTITKSGNYWLIGDGSKYIYHSNGGSSGTNLTYGTSTTYKWKLTYSTSTQNHWTFKGVDGTTENSRGMLCNGTSFGGYALSNESGYKFMNIYEVVSTKTLSSIALSGTYPTSFTQGDEFSHAGMTVTATYDDASTADVTSKATFSGYNMANAGDQTVTVSYTESGTTKTATYGINVAVAIMHTVSGTITNGSLSSTANVREGKPLNINIVANDKCSLPASLDTVTMGGNTLVAGSGYTYNSSTGAFSITSVAGDVVINATCTKNRGYWPDNPYTVSEAWSIIDALSSSGGNTNYIAYVSGTISTDPSINSHGGADFEMTDGSKTIIAYSVAGAKITAEGEGIYIQNGYSVVVSGALIKYVKNTETKYEVGYKNAQLPGNVVSAESPSYTVSFNANGGSGEMASVPDQHGSYTLPANGFIAPENKVFAGWKANNAGNTINAGDSYDLSADVTFYAQWGTVRTLTVNISNGSAEAPETIIENGSATITLTPAEGYKLPAISQSNITNASFVSFNNGALVINNPTDNVTVTVECVALANYTITVNATNCTYDGDTSIQENGQATINFVAASGYVLPGLADITVSGATKVSFTDGALVINNPTGNVSITVSGAQYDNDFNIVNGGQYKIYHTVSSVKYYLVGTTTDTAQAFTTKSWEATVFTFTLVGDNAISIVSGENKLYNTDNNNGVRFGSEETTWTISAGTHYDLDKKALAIDGDGYYNLKGSYDRYLGLYMGTNNTTPTDFRCYQFNKPDIGTKTYNLARMSATQFEYFDSSAFAQDLLSATNTVCSQSGTHSASDFTTLWGHLETGYKALSSADKTAFDTAERNESGTVLEQAAARYDQVAGKYSLKNFASRTPILVRSTTPIFDSEGRSLGYILVISISGLTILAIGILLVSKKKHR